MSDAKPLFVLKWDKDNLLVLLTSIVGGFLVSIPAGDFDTSSPLSLSWILSAVCLFAGSLYINWRGTLKVREIKFYDNTIMLSGLKFAAEYTYEDISSLKLVKDGGFFYGDKLVFAIKYESRPFRSGNPKNGELGADLYTWMSTKVPPASIQRRSGQPAPLTNPLANLTTTD